MVDVPRSRADILAIIQSTQHSLADVINQLSTTHGSLAYYFQDIETAQAVNHIRKQLSTIILEIDELINNTGKVF